MFQKNEPTNNVRAEILMAGQTLSFNWTNARHFN